MTGHQIPFGLSVFAQDASVQSLKGIWRQVRFAKHAAASACAWPSTHHCSEGPEIQSPRIHASKQRRSTVVLAINWGAPPQSLPGWEVPEVDAPSEVDVWDYSRSTPVSSFEWGCERVITVRTPGPRESCESARGRHVEVSWCWCCLDDGLVFLVELPRKYQSAWKDVLLMCPLDVQCFNQFDIV